MLTLYPNSLDTFISNIDAYDGGTSVTESLTVTSTSPYTIALNHSLMASSSVTIPGYISTSTNPPAIANRFYIDYDEDELIFHSTSSNATLPVSYLSDGDDIFADDINKLQEAIVAIETVLGVNPSYPKATVKAYLTYLNGKFHQTTGHKHTGGTEDAPQIALESISGLSIYDRHIATNAGIDTVKIAYYSPNVVSTTGTSTLEDTLDYLLTQINEVSTSAGVQSICVSGQPEITGDITFVGQGITLNQDTENDIVYFSTSAAVSSVNDETGDIEVYGTGLIHVSTTAGGGVLTLYSNDDEYVSAMKAVGYDFLTGQVQFDGLGGTTVSQSGQVVYISSSDTLSGVTSINGLDGVVTVGGYGGIGVTQVGDEIQVSMSSYVSGIRPQSEGSYMTGQIIFDGAGDISVTKDPTLDKIWISSSGSVSGVSTLNGLTGDISLQYEGDALGLLNIHTDSGNIHVSNSGNYVAGIREVNEPSYLNGQILFECDDSSVTIAQLSDRFKFSTHKHYTQITTVTAGQAADGIIAVSPSYTTGNNSLDVYWNKWLVDRGVEYEETDEDTITFNIAGEGQIAENDTIKLKWWK